MLSLLHTTRRVTATSRIIPPTLPTTLLSSSFHTTTPLHESRRKRIARMTKMRNLEKRNEKVQYLSATKPHPVLGTSPGDTSKWETCDLAKILLSEEKILAQPILPLSSSSSSSSTKLNLPNYFGHGIGPTEQRLLFEDLPVASAQQDFLQMDLSSPPTATVLKQQEEAEKREMMNANVFARIVDLRNASARGIAFENRRRCIEAFSEPGKPDDTGRPEVQAALLTAKIRNLWDHLNRCPRDIHNRRSLRTLVHQRAKVLKYLKGKDEARYTTVLMRLGIEPRAVEGEIVV